MSRDDAETQTLIAFSSKDSGLDAGRLAPTLRAMNHSKSHANAGGQIAIAHTLTGGGFDASDDGTGRGTPIVPVLSPTLRAGGNATGGHRPPGTDVDTVESLIPVEAFRTTGNNGAYSTGDMAPCLNTGTDPNHTVLLGLGEAVGVSLRGREGGGSAEITTGAAPALRASQGGGDKPHVMTGMTVRRLTPTECARLQGFPDTYLDIAYRGKPAADGNKYRALGNSMAVPVMVYLGQRIAAVQGKE